MLTILFDFYPGGEELVRRNHEVFPLVGGYVQIAGRLDTQLRRQMVDQHDESLCRESFDIFRQQGTHLCPTHVTRKMDAYAHDPAFREDWRFKYIPAAQRADWQDDADRMVALDPSPEGRQVVHDFYRLGHDFVGRAHMAGVPILAGTDAPDTYNFPGFSLHDELEDLVLAGLTPGEALAVATISGARFLGLDDDYGSIEPGKVADLVLLSANPLEAIGNSRRIEAIVFDGNLSDRAALDDLLSFVETSVAELDQLGEC